MGAKRRILLAHYDAERARELSDQLTKGNRAEVVHAADGESALRLFKESAPDVTVLSGVLPRKLGFDVCRLIKEDKAKSPPKVAILTDQDDRYGRGRARQVGADLVIEEPLRSSDIDDVLNLPETDFDSLDLARTGSRSHHERLLAAILKEGGATKDSILSKFTDPVTGLFDRSYIRLKLEDEFKKTQRYGMPLSVVLVDIDNYDDIVSRYGPVAGDSALLDVSSVFLCGSRDIDAAGRLDRSRFLFILPNTDQQGARTMADRVLSEVLEKRVETGDEVVVLRLSVGIASCPSERITSVDQLLESALKGLTASRASGGNKICVWGEAR
ncbi:MAG: diguanylate cyclase [Planctomycetota bacterium]